MRWGARHKKIVVCALLDGTLSAADARRRYMLSDEELANWMAAYDLLGLGGLQLKSVAHRRRFSQQQPGSQDVRGRYFAASPIASADHSL